MQTNLKPLLCKYRHEPDELLAALSGVPPGELARDVVDLLTAGELCLQSRKRRRANSLCAKGYAYDRANPWVRDWFLSAAQEKRKEGRTNYGIGNLLEKLPTMPLMGLCRSMIFESRMTCKATTCGKS